MCALIPNEVLTLIRISMGSILRHSFDVEIQHYLACESARFTRGTPVSGPVLLQIVVYMAIADRLQLSDTICRWEADAAVLSDTGGHSVPLLADGNGGVTLDTPTMHQPLCSALGLL